MPASPEDIKRSLRAHWIRDVRAESERLGLSVREAAQAIFAGELNDHRAAVSIGSALSLLGIGPDAKQVDPDGLLKGGLPVARKIFEDYEIFMPIKQ